MTHQSSDSVRGKTLWQTAVQAPTLTKLYWLLRIGVSIEYLGHGWAGLSRSRAWLPYYDLFGIPADFALDYLMYITGTVDITVGLLILFWPARILLLHATVWGVFTALLRPTVGEGWWEFLERGGNYGMPLALLIMAGWGGWSLRRWLQRVDAPAAVSDTVYVTNTLGGTVSVINPRRNTVSATITVGANPRGLALHTGNRIAYVANSGSDTVSTFDTSTNTVLSEVAVGDDPRWTASGPAGTFLYVTNTGSHSVSILTLKH